jgi:hypothetical protein
MLSAAQAGKHSPFALLGLFFYPVTEEPFFPLAGALALFGVLACYRDRRLLLPIWLLAIFFLDPRKAPTDATVPLAILAALGLQEVVLPLLTRQWHTGARATRDSALARPALAMLGGACVLYLLIGALLSGGGQYSPLAAVSHEQRKAMQWIETNTPLKSVFLVMPISGRWSTDAVTEWFPVLASRRSVTTVQGAEWMGASTYRHADEAFIDLEQCNSRRIGCLDDWLSNSRVGSHSHIFLPTAADDTYDDVSVSCCPELEASLRTDRRFLLIHDGPGGSVFEVRR